MASANRKPRKKAENSNVTSQMFFHNEIGFPIPHAQCVATELMTRSLRKLPEAFGEAIEQLEKEITALTGGEALTLETWSKRGAVLKRARVKASMAVLLSFGVTHFPVPADEESGAPAMAIAA